MGVRSRIGLFKRLYSWLGVLVLSVMVPACTVRFIAEHDAALEGKVLALRRDLRVFFVRLGTDAGTPEGRYELFADDYERIKILLRDIEAHAASLAQNRRTLSQVRLLMRSVEHLEAIHREGIAHRDVVHAIREQFEVALSALLALEGAKRCGAPTRGAAAAGTSDRPGA